jgi:glycosyltransferase involved in cell wall biosynthesis
MLCRILRAVPPENYCLISSEDYSGTESEDGSPRLPARYHHLSTEFQFQRPNRFGLYRLRKPLNLLTQVLDRAKQVAKIMRAEKCDAIMACSGDVVNIPAAYLASRWVRVPLHIYLFDDYLYQWTRRLDRSFARFAERIAIKGAATVIVPNEFLRDEYRRRYGVQAVVIHNPHEDLEAEDTDGSLSSEPNSEVRIVFTGAIYHANYGAFRNLLAAIEQLGRPEVKLHLYTSQPLEGLEQENIRGPIVYHEHVAPAAAQRVQRRADILFLPLSLNSGIPEVVKTSAPGKLGEYMATGRPILAHAPEGSFVSWYFHEYQCGVIVDQCDPASLAQAIERLLDEPELRQRIGMNARARARIDFSLAGAQAKFLELISPQRK